jgi:hypothetical protein
MFCALAPLKPKLKEIERLPALQDPAVAHCHEAWIIAYRRVMRREKSRLVACKEAGDAFLSAMPPLSGIENIRSFVACVGFALASGVLSDHSATKLLYAAKVARNVGTPLPSAKTITAVP